MRRFARLFTLRTRTEVWLVIYVLALGAVERGRLYVEQYPGVGGWLLALACTGVVFLAGAKLLDSVRPAPAAAPLDVATSVVVDPEIARRIPSQPHHAHLAQIDAAPDGRGPAVEAGANVERAIGIGEADRGAATGSRRYAERAPFLCAEAADRDVSHVAAGPIDEGEVVGSQRGRWTDEQGQSNSG